jgi:hydroxymethylpyrimidine/phosphomethylpyrimidine kinase
VSAVLVIAGSDSSGGAGLTRDVRTLAQLHTEALCAVTAVTAQSDMQVSAVHLVPPQVVRVQIEAGLSSGRVRAVKIGMLGGADTVAAVAAGLAAHAVLPVVLDPVLAATSGGTLLDAGGRQALCELLLPKVLLLTPNIPEAAALLGVAPATGIEQLQQQGQALLARGLHAVLMKGGHAAGPEATDVLLVRGAPPQRFSAPRRALDRRGTGCVLSTAIAAALAAGLELTAACARAKEQVTRFLQHGD